MNFDSLQFAQGYSRCRQQFCSAAQSLGYHITSKPMPEHSALTMDWVHIGSADAKNLLVITSGTHGAELPAGSYCQVRMMLEGRFRDLGDDIAVLLIHAVNPWGAQYLRRHNEDNIDLCRNHLDFSDATPSNQDYASMAIAVESVTAGSVEAFMSTQSASMGPQKLLGALMAGQYEYPNGFSYGGDRLSWSNNTLLTLLKDSTEQKDTVIILDYHTGVGPYGYGSAVTMHKGPQLDLARRVFGNWVVAPCAQENEDIYYQVTGHSTDGYQRSVNDAFLLNVVLEFGTYSWREMLRVLLLQHCAGLQGSEEAKQISEYDLAVASFFSPQDPDWQHAIWQRSCMVVDQAVRFLAV
jgi:hypothetical protein